MFGVEGTVLGFCGGVWMGIPRPLVFCCLLNESVQCVCSHLAITVLVEEGEVFGAERALFWVFGAELGWDYLGLPFE